jgi:hypothetical protein
MAYLAEFWIILESDLVECAPHRILLNKPETIPEHTIDCNLTNTISLTEFGSVMKNL